MPNWPTPIALMDTSQNPPGVSCLVHSGQVAKQHESSFLYDRKLWSLFIGNFLLVLSKSLRATDNVLDG